MAERGDDPGTRVDLEEAPDGSASGGGPNDGWAFTSQRHYDPADSRELTTVVVDAIAEAEGVSMTEVTDPPLYDVVDIASVQSALFGRPAVERQGADSAVEFHYDGYLVSVEADGWVSVYRWSDGTRTE